MLCVMLHVTLHAMLCVMLCVMLHHVKLCVMQRHVMLCVMLRYVLACPHTDVKRTNGFQSTDVTVRYVLCYVTPCYAMCYVTLCNGKPTHTLEAKEWIPVMAWMQYGQDLFPVKDQTMGRATLLYPIRRTNRRGRSEWWINIGLEMQMYERKGKKRQSP